MKKDELDTKSLNEVIILSKKILNVFFIVLIFALIFIGARGLIDFGILNFLGGVLKVLSPLFIGFVLAWIFNPVVTRLEKRKVPRFLSTVLIYAVLLLVIVLFIRYLVPTIYTQVQSLVNNLPSMLDGLESLINKILNGLNTAGTIDVNSIKENIITTVNTNFNSMITGLPNVLINLTGTIASSLVTIFLSLFIGIYMLIDFPRVNEFLIGLLPDRMEKDARELTHKISVEVRKSVNGTLIVASMVFICDSLGFTIAGLTTPILFGLLCGITDLIPYVGPYIGGGIAVIVGFATSPVVGFVTMIVAIVVQLVENNILQPIVMSKAMKLHPVTIMLGLLIFEHFFGMIGMIVATPCIALGKVLLEFGLKKYNQSKNKELNTKKA